MEPSKSWEEANEEGTTAMNLFMHGGPHSVTVPVFVPLFYILAEFFGVCTFMPNYRGSAGFDEAYVQVLTGHAGDMDCSDCERSADAMRKQLGVFDKPVFCMGGKP